MHYFGKGFPASLIHVQVDLFEVLDANLSRARLVTLIDELHDVLLTWRERQVLAEHLLQVTGCDVVLTLLVEESEAFGGFRIFAWLTQTLEPVIGDDALAELKVHSVSLGDQRVGLPQLLLNLTGSHLVEAEVLQNVPEQVVWDPVLIVLTVSVEAVFEVVSNLNWQVELLLLDVVPHLRNVQLLLSLLLLLLACSLHV